MREPSYEMSGNNIVYLHYIIKKRKREAPLIKNVEKRRRLSVFNGDCLLLNAQIIGLLRIPG